MAPDSGGYGMHRTPQTCPTVMYRSWGLDRRAWQRFVPAGALAAAVSSATFGWAIASPAAATQTPAIVRFAEHGPGHAGAVYGMTDAPAAGLRVTLNNL